MLGLYQIGNPPSEGETETAYRLSDYLKELEKNVPIYPDFAPIPNQGIDCRGSA
jgi:hypothetical protein